MSAALPVCKGKLRNLRADCSTFGLYCVTLSWQRILTCSLQITVVGVLPSGATPSVFPLEPLHIRVAYFHVLQTDGEIRPKTKMAQGPALSKSVPVCIPSRTDPD